MGVGASIQIALALILTVAIAVSARFIVINHQKEVSFMPLSNSTVVDGMRKNHDFRAR